MAERPQTAVLSDEIKAAVAGRRLVAAVFLTFRFEPDFFEQQVLPLFFDTSLSHAENVKRAQMEQAIQTVPDGIAIYYDQNGLATGGIAARLDVRRIAVRHATGIFHPKNVFALVENVEANKSGKRERSLIAASMSANLTRKGWLLNVEAAHIVEIKEGRDRRLRDSLHDFLERFESRVAAKAADSHASIKSVRAFLRSDEKSNSKPDAATPTAKFFDGSEPFVDFLDRSAGKDLHGLNLEVISPYFDKGPESAPLADLIDRFSPKEVRVFLPKSPAGNALCSKEIFDWVRAQDEVSWAKLPQEIVSGGKAGKAKDRTVHAKVYRFFSSSPKAEYLFIGSVNLTGAAHRNGGNLETGYLVQGAVPKRPDWWMDKDSSRPKEFQLISEDEGAVSTSGSRLSIRYWWDSKKAEAYWDDSAKSKTLQVSWGGGDLFEITPLPQRVWQSLSTEAGSALESVLRSASILKVAGDRPDPVYVLVQEEGMKSKPSVLFDLTPAEILEYWSLLSPQQKAAFLEMHAPVSSISEGDAALVTKYKPLDRIDSFFARFAGVFMSFGALEKSVRESLEAGNTRNIRAAEYRIFGQKYDGLGHLLDRVGEEVSAGKGDPVEQYVIALCAQQTVTVLRKDFPQFFEERRGDMDRLKTQLSLGDVLRAKLEDTNADLASFLPWFEGWFLRRAEPVNPEDA